MMMIFKVRVWQRFKVFNDILWTRKSRYDLKNCIILFMHYNMFSMDFNYEVCLWKEASKPKNAKVKWMGYLAKDENVQVKLMKGFLIESNV